MKRWKVPERRERKGKDWKRCKKENGKYEKDVQRVYIKRRDGEKL